MQKARPAELVLGSVQLGLAYGAANRTGKPSLGAALQLVHRAADAGVTHFDTARAYGDSENRLGEALVARKGVRTITKLSPLNDVKPDASPDEVCAAVDSSIAASLDALRRDKLDCLLLHRASHMTDFGGAVWDRLIELLEQGTILSLGVSVQSPREALMVLDCCDVQHIQLPFNILDWRWRESGVIDRIRARAALTVHARSIFLQGLLTSGDARVWPNIHGVDAHEILETVSALASCLGRQNAADLCLAYARGQDWIDGVVVGMETEDQLDANLRLAARPPLSPQHCARVERGLPRVPPQLLNPALWPKA
jgi:aryl-alcohol dehydrogenase-like predicted oxidoreductase